MLGVVVHCEAKDKLAYTTKPGPRFSQWVENNPTNIVFFILTSVFIYSTMLTAFVDVGAYIDRY
jgi:hypothetical protein